MSFKNNSTSTLKCFCLFVFFTDNLLVMIFTSSINEPTAKKRYKDKLVYVRGRSPNLWERSRFAYSLTLWESATIVTNWYYSNILEGNLNKYQTMNICNKGSNEDSNPYNISVKGNLIETSDGLKLLGVTMDSRLNFSNHISSTCVKASQRIGVLMRLRNLIPTMAKLLLYKSAILPYLTYCHLVWNFC